MNRCYLLPVLLIFLATASAQSPADSLLQVLSGKSGKDRVSFINGHFYEFYSQDFNVAIRLVEEAKTLAMQNNWQPEVAASEKNLGIIHYLKGNYEKALEAYHAALSLYEKTGDDAGRGFTLKELGNYYKKQKQYDTALQKLAEGLLACKAAGNEQCHAEVLDIQGVTLLEMGKLNEAESVFEKEKEVLHTLNNERSMSYVLDHLSEVAILRGQHERALVLLQESNALRQKVGDAHGIAININNMGEVMLQAGLPERAVPFFTEAVQRSTAIGFHDLRRHAMQQLSEAHAGSGQAALAIQWLQKSVALKDSMFNEERSRQIAEMSAKYETEKKELELVRQSQRLQRRGMWLAIAVALLAILTAFFTSVLRKQKQKQREMELKAELASSEAANRLQEERLRISRDLHDNLGAELSIIGSNLSRKAFHSANEQEKVELEAIGDNARQAMGMLRETIWAIRHEQFTIQQLADKIRDFATRATVLPLNFQISNSQLLLSPTQTLNLYRIAQEAITNALKYADAKAIQILLEADKNLLKMKISDDGKGFDQLQASNGNGLTNMRSRMAELGGQLSVSSGADGSIITAELPIPGKH